MPTTPARHWIAALLPALVAAAVPAGAAGAWLPPVAGPVIRAFDLDADPFAPGQHRGADLAAPPGAKVRAPCSGRVAFAGPVATSDRVVTLVCGPWRVTHLPLATTTVRAGENADRGDTLGTVARSPGHGGLHLGVRRAGDRYAYTDPLPFLGHDRLPPPPVPAPRSRRQPPTGPVRAPAPDRVRTPAAPERRATAHPTHSVPAVEPAPLPTAAGSERTAARPERPPAAAGSERTAARPERPPAAGSERTAARRERPPAAGSERTAARPERPPAAGSERTAVRPERPPAAGNGPPWPIAAGLLLALAALARRPRLPRPRRARRHTRPAAEVP